MRRLLVNDDASGVGVSSAAAAAAEARVLKKNTIPFFFAILFSFVLSSVRGRERNHPSD